MRGKLPEHMKKAKDDQIRAFLIRTKQDQMVRNIANGTTQGQLGLPNQAQGSMGTSDVSQHPQVGQAKAPMQQNQTVADPAINQGAKQGQGNRSTLATKQPQKGTKRNSHEDVVEVPNPNLANSQARAQVPKHAQPTKQQSSSQMQGNKAPSDAKDSSKAPNQSQAAESQGGRPPGMPNIPKEELDRRDARLRQLVTEVAQSAPARNAVPIAPQLKAQMTHKLRELGQMVMRMEMSFQTFFRNNPDENITRQLIQTVSLPHPPFCPCDKAPLMDGIAEYD